ncbi:ParB N-terminal domain-containing protein [Streptacidiphilus sp. MAP5-52]|uniref:ParB N-terminal domain-containing protein n=1 Tax=Streptacidiphilus sp. MAP5-52 TaxID=3156267 RepID=UPI003514B601
MRALTDSIRAHGLFHPIVRDANDQILDGRSRLEACRKAGVKPQFTVYDGSADPGDYALSANLHRRTLSRGQAAMIAVKACSVSEQQQRSDSERSARSVSERAGLSLGRVGQALTVARYAEELVEQVIAGTVGLDEALKTAQHRKAEAAAREDVAQLAKLREEDPELADQVEAGKLSMVAALLQRQTVVAEHSRQQQVATDLLCQLLPSIAQLQGGDAFGKYDPERAQPERRVTRKVIAQAQAALAEAAAVWKERGLA